MKTLVLLIFPLVALAETTYIHTPTDQMAYYHIHQAIGFMDQYIGTNCPAATKDIDRHLNFLEKNISDNTAPNIRQAYLELKSKRESLGSLRPADLRTQSLNLTTLRTSNSLVVHDHWGKEYSKCRN